MSTVTNVKFEDFKKFTKDPSALVIDVREPDELRETGAIPGSINIPRNYLFAFSNCYCSIEKVLFVVNQVQNVLKNLNKDEFRKQYRHEKPDPSTKVVFTCRSGRRSAQAAQIADKLGYKK